MVANSALNSDGFAAITTWDSTSYDAYGNSVVKNPLNNPFPSGVQQVVGSKAGLATNIGSQAYTELHTQRTPTTYDFNLGVQAMLPQGFELTTAYVGSRAHFLPVSGVKLNELPLSVIATYKDSLVHSTAPNQWTGVYSGTTVPLYVSLQSYPQFTNGGINTGITAYGYPAGDSTYDSLQVKLEKKLANGFTSLATFTWGKLLTDDYDAPLSFVGNSGGKVQDWRDMEYEHALSGQDLAKAFTWQASYDLPVGRGKRVNLNGVADKVLGGWTLNGILYLNSGVPIAAPGSGQSSLFSQRVDQTCNPNTGAERKPSQWFNYSCFATPANDYTPGTSKRMLSVRQDGAHQLDASVLKSVPIVREHAVRLEVSAYNVTNKVQFGTPDVFWKKTPTTANMAGFGVVSSDVNTPRQLQFAAKYTF
jgi:hypothetical protein